MMQYRTPFENELEWTVQLQKNITLQPRAYRKDILAEAEGFARRTAKLAPTFTKERVLRRLSLVDGPSTSLLPSTRNIVAARRSAQSNNTLLTYELIVTASETDLDSRTPRQMEAHLQRQAHFGNLREVATVYRKKDSFWTFAAGIWAYPGRCWSSRNVHDRHYSPKELTRVALELMTRAELNEI